MATGRKSERGQSHAARFFRIRNCLKIVFAPCGVRFPEYGGIKPEIRLICFCANHRTDIHRKAEKKGRQYTWKASFRLSLKVESEAYQALTELRRQPVSERYIVSQAALVKKSGGRIVVEDAFDTGVETNNDTVIGGLIGGLVGILGGPLGMLMTGSVGALTGSIIDAGDAAYNASLLEKVAEQFADGEVAVIALAQESESNALDEKLAAFKTTIAREDAAEVAEEILLEEAVKKNYAYYHLLSGMDMPLKTQNEIHRFFEERDGQEFIHFDDEANADRRFLGRIRFYHFFRERISQYQNASSLHKRGLGRLLTGLERTSRDVQKAARMNRIKGMEEQFYTGAQWFSVTHTLASYLLSQQDWVRRHLRYSECADELLVQTLAMNPPYKDRVARNNMRLID